MPRVPSGSTRYPVECGHLPLGKNDPIFPAEGAHPYKRDLKNVEFHILDGGHFVLESHGDLIADEILDFLDRELE